MHRSKLWIALLILPLAGCVTTRWESYPQGKLKYSEISYKYRAQPILEDPTHQTYALRSNVDGVGEVRGLEKAGVRRSDGTADVVIEVHAGTPSHEPVGVGLAKPFKPGLSSTLPISITVKDASGSTVLQRSADYGTILEVPGTTKTFPTREEAAKAMAPLLEMARKAADRKLMEGAAGSVRKSLKGVARDLLEPRTIKVQLPVVRSAGHTDLEKPYAILAGAKGPEQIREGLSAYEAIEAGQTDTSDATVLDRYGVACGIAAARILAGDLGGAWSATKKAWKIFPMGKEHRRIAQILRDQEKEAGVEIIPEEDYQEMMNADRKAMADQLQRLFGGRK
jgi:hypothetical protein